MTDILEWIGAILAVIYVVGITLLFIFSGGQRGGWDSNTQNGLLIFLWPIFFLAWLFSPKKSN